MDEWGGGTNDLRTSESKGFDLLEGAILDSLDELGLIVAATSQWFENRQPLS
jgi:hypothetical protein